MLTAIFPDLVMYTSKDYGAQVGKEQESKSSLGSQRSEGGQGSAGSNGSQDRQRS